MRIFFNTTLILTSFLSLLVMGIENVQAQDSETVIIEEKNSDAKPKRPPGDNFDMEVLADGSIARMNRQTGTMSLCVVKDGEMVCRLAADERDAYEEEISQLSNKLSKRDSGDGSANSTDDDDQQKMKFERALEFSQEFMRRFYGVIQEMQKEYPDLQGNGGQKGTQSNP